MPQLKSEGFILKTIPWKENSRILTFFSEEKGRQSIIDRGGRSLKSKKGRLLTFARLEITWYKSDRSGTGYISEVEPLEIFSFESDGHLGRLTFASAALEILYGLLPEDEQHGSVYHLTIQFFRLVDRVPKQSLYPTFMAYLIRLVSLLGYRPNFTGCVLCGKEIKRVSNGTLFVPSRGGMVCSACQIPGEYYIKLRSERLEQIRLLQVSSLTEAAAIEMKVPEAEELLELMLSFLKYQTEMRELKSLQFLEKLKKAAKS